MAIVPSSRSKEISDLPVELLLLIFSYVKQIEDLLSCNAVCKKWHAISQDNTLWQPILQNRVHYLPLPIAGVSRKKQCTQLQNMAVASVQATLSVSETPHEGGPMVATSTGLCFATIENNNYMIVEVDPDTQKERGRWNTQLFTRNTDIELLWKGKCAAYDHFFVFQRHSGGAIISPLHLLDLTEQCCLQTIWSVYAWTLSSTGRLFILENTGWIMSSQASFSEWQKVVHVSRKLRNEDEIELTAWNHDYLVLTVNIKCEMYKLDEEMRGTTHCHFLCNSTQQCLPIGDHLVYGRWGNGSSVRFFDSLLKIHQLTRDGLLWYPKACFHDHLIMTIASSARIWSMKTGEVVGALENAPFSWTASQIIVYDKTTLFSIHRDQKSGVRNWVKWRIPYTGI